MPKMCRNCILQRFQGDVAIASGTLRAFPLSIELQTKRLNAVAPPLHTPTKPTHLRHQISMKNGHYFLDGPVFLKSGVTLSGGDYSYNEPSRTYLVLHNHTSLEDAVIVIDGGTVRLTRADVMTEWHRVPSLCLRHRKGSPRRLTGYRAKE